MDIMEAIRERHSVRSYTDQKIEGPVLAELQETIRQCNEESGLHIQLFTDEPEAFSGAMAKYGSFRNVKNYIALVGKKSPKLEETCGYYGEKIVLKAQQFGLNTCWVALTYSKKKSAVRINAGEKLLMVISIGYGETPGVPHRSKPLEKLSNITPDAPEWFCNGVIAAQLAPTATNQQKFYIERKGNKVKATPGLGFYAKTDLGIVRYHFEQGAANGTWQWADED